MKVAKRAVCFIFSLIFAIGISGCGKEAASADTQPERAASVNAETTLQDDGVYQSTIEKTEVDNAASDSIRYGCAYNGIVYYIYSKFDENRQYYMDFIRSVSAETGETVREDFSINDGEDPVYISSIAPCGDDAFIFTSNHWEENKSISWLYKCSADGTVLNKKNLSEIPRIPEDATFYSGIASDGTNIYLPTDTKLLVLGEGLNYKRTISDSTPMSMCLGDDGCLYFIDNFEGNISVYNPKTDKITESIANIPSARALFKGGDGEIFAATNTSLKSLNTVTKEIVKLFDYLDANINTTSFNGMLRDTSGDIHLFYYDLLTDNESGVPGAMKLVPREAVVKRYEADSVPKTDEIWLACFYANPDIKDAISEYNMSHPNLKVKLKCYSDEISDYNAQIEAYDRDLLNGVVYDIIKFDRPDLSKYTEKGLLENLVPYIEKDSSFDLNKYYENILLAKKEGDKLYSLVSGTMIIDLLGNVATFGDKESITFDDVIKARTEKPGTPFIHYVTNGLGATLMLLNIDYRMYLGGKEGVYDFTTPEFKKLCEFASTFPATTKDDFIPAYSFEQLAEGTEVLAREYYWSPEAYLTTKSRYGNKIKSYKGLTLDGDSYYMEPSTTYSISSQSNHKEEAWEVIKILLDAKNKYSSSEFRASKEVTAYDLDYYYMMFKDNISVRINGTDTRILMDKSDYDVIENMLEHATLGHSLDDIVRDIVREELPAFFTGEKSFDEVVKVMQKRVNLYIEEKK